MEVESSVPLVSRYERCLLCPCNSGACHRRTSKTAANPDRDFYTCPNPEQCSIGNKGFFKWVDMVRDEELIDVPICGGCSAGRCRVRRELSGPNAGRILFTCRVKEGQGSCGYRVWQDELEMSATAPVYSSMISPLSTLTKFSDTIPSNLNFTEKGQPPVVKEEDEPPLIATSWKMTQSKCQKDKPLIATSRNMKQSKRQEDEHTMPPLGKSHDGDHGAESSAESESRSPTELRKTKVDRCENWTNNISRGSEVSTANGECECGLNPILLTLRHDKNQGRLLWVCPLDQCNYFRWEDNGVESLRIQGLLKHIVVLEGLIRKYRRHIKQLIAITVATLVVMGIVLIFK